MFIREKHRQPDGKGLPYLVLVESRPTPGGTRQEIILSLGRLDLSRRQRQVLADMVTRRLAGQQTVLDESAELQDLADQIVAKILIRRAKRTPAKGAEISLPASVALMRVTGVRELGPGAVFEEFWRRLRSDDVFRSVGASSAEMLRIKLAVFCRMSHFGTTADEIGRLEGACYADWVAAAHKHYRQSGGLVPERIIKRSNEVQDLLWERLRGIVGTGDTARFIDLRNRDAHLLLDGRGGIVRYHVPPRGSAGAPGQISLFGGLSREETDPPVVVFDSSQVREKDLRALADANVQYYVMRAMLLHGLDRILGQQVRLQNKAEGKGDSEAHPLGDLFLALYPGRRQGESRLRAERSDGQRFLKAGCGEWFVRTNIQGVSLEGILRNTETFERARERFRRVSGEVRHDTSHRGLRGGFLVSVIAYHISFAVEEVMKATGDFRGWDRLYQTLQAHSAISFVTPDETKAGCHYLVTLSNDPSPDVQQIYRTLGMDEPAIRNVRRVISGDVMP